MSVERIHNVHQGHNQRSFSIRYWIGFILVLVFILIGALIIYFSISFKITNIVFNKNDMDVNLRYPKMQKILEVVKGTNLLVLSSDFLEKSLKIPFPELKTITIEKKYPSTVIVSAETYPIVSKWVYKKEGDTRQFFGFVSENGYFLPKGSDDAFLMFDMQVRKKEIPFYALLLPAEQLKNIMDAKWVLEDITKRKMTSLAYYQNAQEIRFVDEKKVEYWLFLQSPLLEQTEKLRTMLQVENIYARPLSYIDLRISKKIIYKPL